MTRGKIGPDKTCHSFLLGVSLHRDEARSRPSAASRRAALTRWRDAQF